MGIGLDQTGLPENQVLLNPSTSVPFGSDKSGTAPDGAGRPPGTGPANPDQPNADAREVAAGRHFDRGFNPDEPRDGNGRWVGFGGWVDQILSGARKPQGQTRRVGTFPEKVKDYLASQGINAGNGAFRIEDSVVLKSMRNSHHSGRQPRKPPTIEDMSALKRGAMNPSGIYWDVRNRTVIYAYPSSDGKNTVKAAIRADHPRGGNRVATIIRVSPGSLMDAVQFNPIS